ncbi:MAG: 2-C-methyl-D-erythritol 4-phosphate cytidylyltransferase [Planctomycetota bacterium]|nr:2-C-methyl-D-erythritol 4-phosphate cytidylyltransferase [Planctomycetota bacterium]
MNVCVIIPAAGRSRRFGESDKLAQDLGGRALLIRTVELFAKRDEVRKIIVAGPPEPPEEYNAFRERYGATLGFHGAAVVPGGTTHRWETVKAALENVPEDVTHIAVHDAARPGADKALLDRVFEAAEVLDAVVPALEINATIKRLSADVEEITPEEDDAIADAILGDVGKATVKARQVVETIDRENLVEIQTPQVFRADLLRRAYAADDLSGVTDDASLVERLGEPVHAVEGDVRNFKVTTPADLKLMRAVMGVKPPADRPVHKRF